MICYVFMMAMHALEILPTLELHALEILHALVMLHAHEIGPSSEFA